MNERSVRRWERQWFLATEPGLLLTNMLPPAINTAARDRKLRLFACACCRRRWRWLTRAESRHAVEVAELFADQFVSAEALHAARLASQSSRSRSKAVASAICTTHPTAFWAASDTATCSGLSPRDATAQVRLVHDLFGNPFRPLSFSPVWRTSVVANLAMAAYQERPDNGQLDPNRLSVLADALEDAGCSEPNLLNHLRNDSPHYRGCFALDAAIDPHRL